MRADELVEVAWRELRDRDRWQPGWRSVLDPVPLGPAALDPAAALHPERVASGTLDAGHDMKPAGQPNQALQPADAAGDRVAPDQ